MRDSGDYSVLQDFRRARHRADLEHIVNFLKKQAIDVLSHNELFTQFQTLRSQPRQTQKIPLDAITGKVSRDKEFSESFFPVSRHNIHDLLQKAVSHPSSPETLEAIELYQIGDHYIVSDGNYRHSMAIQSGAQVIEAFVTPIAVTSAFSQDLQADDVILHVESRKFLTRTRLDSLRAWTEHEITIPGKYQLLEKQLDVFRYLFCEFQQCECSDEELVLLWYDTLYLPAIRLIETLEILHDFPKRTAGDLYVWIYEHRAALINRIGNLKKLPEALTAISQHSDTNIDKPKTEQEYLSFLEDTQLRQLRPEADIPLSAPEEYHILRDHINVHRYFMGLERRRAIPYREAATHWHDEVYYPIAQAIRQQNLLEYFPAYNIGDLYLWISAYQIISRRDDVSRAEEFLTETLTAALPDFPDEMLEAIIISIEYIDFLLHTQLKVLRPKADLSINIPGKYRNLEEHINVHRHFMGIEQQREIPYHEAVGHWYDRVYLPTLEEIAKQGILRAFPDLRATSLYLWVCEHRSKLEQQLGGSVDIATAAMDLVTHFGSKKSAPLFHRQQLNPETSRKETSRQPFPFSQKKREEYALRRRESLFAEILVLVTARQSGKLALEQALETARREGARLTGLQVHSSEHQLHTDGTLKLRSYFEQRCHAAGVEGSFHIEAGDLQEKTTAYSRLCDLIVFPSDEGADAAPISLFREKEAFSRNMRLLCAEHPSPLRSALIPYDNTQSDNEALFTGAYLTSRWGIALTILTSGIDAADRAFVKEYLDIHGLEAEFLQQRGSFQASLLKVAHEHGCDFIIAGSREILPGKQDLTELKYPLFLCR